MSDDELYEEAGQEIELGNDCEMPAPELEDNAEEHQCQFVAALGSSCPTCIHCGAVQE